MTTALSRLSLCVLLLGGAAAQAAPVNISNAAFAGTYVRDCRSPAAIAGGATSPDRCEVTNDFIGAPIIERQEQLTLGGTGASVTATHALSRSGANRTHSTIDASGEAGVLALHQAAFTSTPYARTSGHSLGLQSFLYTGAGETRTLQSLFDFTSNVTPNTELGAGGASGSLLDPVVYARTAITVFSLSAAMFAYDDADTANGVFSTMQAEGFAAQAALTGADYRLEGQVITEGITTPGVAAEVTVTLEDGRYYFVNTYLGLWALFGGNIDASHTLTSTWGRMVGSTFVADNSGLAAADELANPVIIVTSEGGTVPEPASWATALLAVALLGATRRRAGRGQCHGR